MEIPRSLLDQAAEAAVVTVPEAMQLELSREFRTVKVAMEGRVALQDLPESILPAEQTVLPDKIPAAAAVVRDGPSFAGVSWHSPAAAAEFGSGI
jgi:hypothetical protein